MVVYLNPKPALVYARQFGTLLDAKSEHFRLRKVNGKWVMPEEAFVYDLSYDNRAWIGFYLPGVKWVDFYRARVYPTGGWDIPDGNL